MFFHVLVGVWWLVCDHEIRVHPMHGVHESIQ